MHTLYVCTQAQANCHRHAGDDAIRCCTRQGQSWFLPASFCGFWSRSSRISDLGLCPPLPPCLSLPLSLPLRTLCPSLPLSLPPSVPPSSFPLSPSLPLSLPEFLPPSLCPCLPEAPSVPPSLRLQVSHPPTHTPFNPTPPPFLCVCLTLYHNWSCL